MRKTFVQLVDDLRVESGASGRTITTVQGNLPAEVARFKKWTADAWLDIQRRQERHWKFLFKESSGFTVPLGATVLNPTEYAAGDIAEWDYGSFRLAPAGGARKDSQPLRFADYFQFRDCIAIDTSVERKPEVITVHPNTEALHIWPAADAEYVLFYDYRRQPQELDDDDDVPIMPDRFHDLIVFWALLKYGTHEAAPEVITRAKAERDALYADLMTDQMPEVGTLGLVEPEGWDR